MRLLQRIYWFCQYLFKRKTKYFLHSPFVFEFATKVLPHGTSDWGQKVAALYQKMCQDKRVVSFEDLGAGKDNKGEKIVTRSVAEIAAKSARRPKEGELLYRICKHYKIKKGLELGTNLGISSLYQLGGMEADAQWVSIEGVPALAEISLQNFDALGQKAEVLIGDFDAVLAENNFFSTYKPDYVFFDGNHQYAPTLRYFYALLPQVQDGAILIFDDIYWSEGMKNAWEEICRHPEVSVSIDLHDLGICIVRRNQAKEHFVL